MFRRRILAGISHSEDGFKIGIGDGVASKARMLGICIWEVKAELSCLTSLGWRYILKALVGSGNLIKQEEI